MDWRQQIASVGPSSRSAALVEVSNAIIDSVSYTPVQRHADTPTCPTKLLPTSGTIADDLRSRKLPEYQTTGRSRIRRYADTLASSLIGLFAILALATSASGDPVQGDGKTSPPVPAANPYAVVNHVGEADRQVTLKDGKLLAHRRTSDPFGIAIRGKFKGLPPITEHPSVVSSPAQPNASPVANVLTLEKAIQQLPIGAVNIADREALIGSRPVHEGDLLVLELSGQQFVIWVQSIDQRGVQFCDFNLQQHAVKPFRFGPNELPDDLAGRRTDVRDFLKQDGN
jgi:hypothetical protein